MSRPDSSAIIVSISWIKGTPEVGAAFVAALWNDMLLVCCCMVPTWLYVISC
jgi:hypothetical protein